MNTLLTFRVIFISAAFALVISPLCVWIVRRLGLVDIPGSAPHKLHDNCVPLAGGMVLVTTLLVINLVENSFVFVQVRAIFTAGVIIFLFGLWDDRSGLRPRVKLLGQVLASTVLIVMGIQVRLFTIPWLDIPLTYFWLIGVTNAYNFVDSMDGLAVGLGGLASAFFMLVTVESMQGDLSLFSLVLIGACLGLYYFNAQPAIYFLGDSGAQLLGLTLAALAIAYNPIGLSRLASWNVPILLVGVPIFDMTLVVFSRLRRRKPVYYASRDHTYHRLVSMGMSPNRAVLTMHTTAILLGALAFIALYTSPMVGNTIFALVLLGGAAAILYLDSPGHWQ